MTNSNARDEAVAIIDEVFDLISEDHLSRWIDKPLEEAAASFQVECSGPIEPRVFLGIMTDFVWHLHQHGCYVRQISSAQEACSEAVAIAEEGYQGPHARGYYAALLDVSNPELCGPELVLGQMTAFIAAKARARYVRWVCASRLCAEDWQTRCLIAGILLGRLRPFLPPNLARCTPAQFADCLPELINTMISIEGSVRSVFGSDTDLTE